jgi:GH25 family lysozyme M1 (1,4-beta-N-acetylmuramidase)
LDIEWDKRAKGLGPDDIVKWCRVFLERIETITARLPIVYTGPSFWRYRLGRSEFFSRYPLWEADYRKSSFQKREPKPIPGWAATFWQYTGKGTSPGVDGRVDLNYFLGTAYDLERVAYVGRARPKIAEATPAKPPSRSVWEALVAKMLERWFGTSSRSASRVV